MRALNRSLLYRVVTSRRKTNVDDFPILIRPIVRERLLATNLVMRSFAVISLFGFLTLCGESVVADQPGWQQKTDAGDDPILAMLMARVEREPGHSDSWRLIGNLQSKRGNPLAAIEPLERALKLDPGNAAAHFDLGQLLLDLGDTSEADDHFRQCVSIAPHSGYAEELYQSGLAQRPVNSDRSVSGGAGTSASASFAFAVAKTKSGSQPTAAQTVGYDIQTFDGADDLERRFNELESDADASLQRLRIFLETGVLYNSNVSLTPISRGLAPVDAESFQAIFNPELEWIAAERGPWRGGPLARGFFTINESTQSEFDLASFQPGAFLERDFTVGLSEWISRIEYLYSLDLLDGNRFGDRHSITASMIIIRPDLDVIYSYVTTSFSQFDDDGADPGVTSLDGTSISGGASRFFQTERSWAPNFSLGIDLESADTEGSDFRYRSVAGHGDVTFQLADRLTFIPGWGVGYRDYYSFTGPVDRDEVTWRVQGKLSRELNDYLSLSLVAGHNRFASDNEAFDAERTEGGILLSYTR